MKHESIANAILTDSLQFLLLPIRDWNLALNACEQQRLNCNFYYSLLGIETNGLTPAICFLRLQFLLLPIRDWNVAMDFVWGWFSHCNFYYSLLGIETWYMLWQCSGSHWLQFLLLPIRDWNNWFCIICINIHSTLQFLLLPIRDWNLLRLMVKYLWMKMKLQFLLLPIRDWNNCNTKWKIWSRLYCNFYYSLLGIETSL